MQRLVSCLNGRSLALTWLRLFLGYNQKGIRRSLERDTTKGYMVVAFLKPYTVVS